MYAASEVKRSMRLPHSSLEQLKDERPVFGTDIFKSSMKLNNSCGRDL